MPSNMRWTRCGSLTPHPETLGTNVDASSASREVYRGRNPVSRVSFSLLANHGHRTIARPLAGESLCNRSVQLACVNAESSGAGSATERRPAVRAMSLKATVPSPVRL